MYSTKVLETLRAYRVYAFSTVLILCSYLILTFVDTIWVFFVVLLLYIVVTNLSWSSFQILFTQNIHKRDLGLEEGFVFTLVNIGWFVGPIIGGLILSYFSFQTVFFFITFVMAVGLLLFCLIHVKHVDTSARVVHTNIFKNVLVFLGKPRLALPYVVSLGGDMFYALINV